MSEQGDLLAELREQGLVDDGVEEPEHGTSDPAEREGAYEQTELSTPEVEGRIWKGAEQLRPYLVRVEDLKESKGNPEKSKGHVARLKASLMKFGQTRPVLIDAGDGRTIIAGHHITKAATDLGWTHIAAVAAEFESHASGRAFGVGDNILALIGNFETSESLQEAIRTGQINRRILEGQLAIIEEIGEEHLAGTGLDLDLLETMRAKTEQLPLIAETEPWGGEAAETAEEAAARAKALEGFEPHKEIPLLMTLPQHEQFKEHVRLLQSAWSIGGVMETILRALAECYEREAAPVGVAAHEGAAPATAPSGEGSSEPGGVTEPGAAPTPGEQVLADAEARGAAGVIYDGDTPVGIWDGPKPEDDDIPL